MSWEGMTLSKFIETRGVHGWRNIAIGWHRDKNPLEWNWEGIDKVYDKWMALPHSIYANLSLEYKRVNILEIADGKAHTKWANNEYVPAIDKLAICTLRTRPTNCSPWFSAEELVDLAEFNTYFNYIGAWYVLVTRHGYLIVKATNKMIKATNTIHDRANRIKYYEQYVPRLYNNQTRNIEYSKEDIKAVYDIYTKIGMVWHLIPSPYYKSIMNIE